VVDSDYNLLPSRHVSANANDVALPLEEAARLLREADAARAKADAEVWKVLAELGIR
jgi:hypothetical protein